MTESTLGQRIARQRKMLSLSQEAFGEKMGVSRQAASKWESGAAVPEIDKLINMSKLFGVSVGWLLGLEDADAPAGEDQPEPDAQILFSFQPPQTEPDPQTPVLPEQPAEPAYEPVPEEPQKKRKNRLTTFCAIVAVVSIILNVISMALYDRLANKIAETASEPTTQDPAIAELEDQVASLKTEVSDYMDTLAVLQSTYDHLWQKHLAYSDLSTAVRELLEMNGEGTELPTPDSLLPVYDNLSKWSLTAQKTTDFTQITLHFSAKSTVNLQAARLDVRKNGETLTSVNCTMAGKHLLGVLTLSPDSGLEYRLVLTHADKTTQTITLEGHGLSDLEVLSRPIIRTTPRNVLLFADKLYFSQGWLNMYVAVPHLAAEDAEYKWSDIRISYYQNGVHISDKSLSEQLEEHYSGEHRIPYLSSQIPAQSFQMQYFEEHDVHTLYLKGTLTVNGVPMEFSVPLREWVVRDGQFFTVNDQ